MRKKIEGEKRERERERQKMRSKKIEKIKEQKKASKGDQYIFYDDGLTRLLRPPSE